MQRTTFAAGASPGRLMVTTASPIDPEMLAVYAATMSALDALVDDLPDSGTRTAVKAAYRLVYEYAFPNAASPFGAIYGTADIVHLTRALATFSLNLVSLVQAIQADINQPVSTVAHPTGSVL